MGIKGFDQKDINMSLNRSVVIERMWLVVSSELKSKGFIGLVASLHLG